MVKLISILFIFIITQTYAQSWLEGQDLQNINYFEIKQKVDSIVKTKENIRGYGIKQFYRWADENRYRINEDGSIRSKALDYQAFKTYKKGHHSASRSEEALPRWWPLGPFDWSADPDSEADNPGMGRINAVKVSPIDENIIAVATASGGLWMSHDGGAHWNTTTDTMGIMAFSDIAFHPTDKNIIYIASGDRDGLDLYGMGVYKSTDGGLTWKKTGFSRATPSLNYVVNRIAMNPLDPNILIIGTAKGVYMTRDGGEDWDQLYNMISNSFSGSSAIMNVKFHPTDTSIIYGCGSDFIVSKNSGKDWTSSGEGLPEGMGRTEMTVGPANPDDIYVITTNTSSDYTGVWRSRDAGDSFTLQSDLDVNVLGYSVIGDDDRSQAHYDLGIAVNPENGEEIFTAGINMWTSIDGGKTMQNQTTWVYDGQPAYCHADVHDIYFEHGRFWLASDGGVFVSDDLGKSWQDLSPGLAISQFYAIQLDEKHNRMLGGTQDNAFTYFSGGQEESLYSGDGFRCAFHPDDTNTFYVATQFGHIWKTEDKGRNFIEVYPLEGEWETPYELSAHDANTLIAGFNDIYKTEDGAMTWTPLTNTGSGQNFEQLALSKSSPDHIYASKGGDFWYSHDGGFTWGENDRAGTISDIEVHPDNPLLVFITIAGSRTFKVMMSENGGEDFVNISDSLPNLDAFTIAYEKDRDGRLYIGMEFGVYYKDTNMTGWEPFMNQLPEVAVRDLKINHTEQVLRAGTYGRGIWQAHLYGNVGIEDSKFQFSDSKLAVYPNPVHDITSISFDVDLGKESRVVIWGMDGKIIMEAKPSDIIIGNWQADLSGLAPGSYIVSILHEEGIASKTIIKK